MKMKTIKNIYTAGLLLGAVIGMMTSCQKSFDPKSYDPPKPPPSFSGYTNSKDIEPTHLAAYWPFSGDLKDSISGTAGVNTGTSFTTGVEGKGLQGAANSYVITAAPAGVTSLHSFTVSVWYNMTEAQNSNGIVNLVDVVNNQYFWGNLDIFLENPVNATTGQVKVHMFNNGASATGTDGWEGDYTITKAFGQWNQVTVTYDDGTGTITVYYNGASIGTNTPTGFTPLNWSGVTQMVFGTVQFQTNPSLTSATGSQSWANYLTGSMDQVRFYNEVLSTTQISALYNLELLGR
jgi:hypothetical protein